MVEECTAASEQHGIINQVTVVMLSRHNSVLCSNHAGNPCFTYMYYYLHVLLYVFVFFRIASGHLFWSSCPVDNRIILLTYMYYYLHVLLYVFVFFGLASCHLFWSY